MSTCVRCGGKLREKNVEIHRRWGEQWYIVRNVPARVCDECQEEYYRADTLKRIDDMRDEIINSPEHTEIPTMDFPKKERAA